VFAVLGTMNVGLKAIQNVASVADCVHRSDVVGHKQIRDRAIDVLRKRGAYPIDRFAVRRYAVWLKLKRGQLSPESAKAVSEDPDNKKLFAAWDAGAPAPQ